jgi:lipopolysaccharide export system permease protein
MKTRKIYMFPFLKFDRQLVFNQLKFNCLIVVFFLTVYCIVDFLEKNTRYFPKYQASVIHIIEYYVIQFPKLVSDLLPFSCLFSSIATFWIFAKSNEITAMRASGASLKRIVYPCLFVGACLSAINFVLAETIVPRALLSFKVVETVKIEKQNFNDVLFDGNWIRGPNAHMKFDSPSLIAPSLGDKNSNYRLSNVEYFQFSQENKEATLIAQAKEAIYDENKKIWILHNGVETKFEWKNNLRVGRNIRFLLRETEIRSQPPKLIKEGIGSDHLSYWTLKQLLKRSPAGTIRSREVDLYQKLTTPVACFFFVFFALPFCLRHERQADTYVGVLWCLVAAIIYWIGNFSLKTLAQNGVVSPFFAAFCVPFLLSIPCAWFFLKLDQQK